MPKIIVVTTENCKWCDKVKEELIKRQLEFNEVKFPKGQLDLAFGLGWETMPRVIIDGVIIGGYEQTVGYFSRPTPAWDSALYHAVDRLIILKAKHPETFARRCQNALELGLATLAAGKNARILENPDLGVYDRDYFNNTVKEYANNQYKV
jgi:glutaredoxin